MTVYLFHLDRPYPRGTAPNGKPLAAQHYLGETPDLLKRLLAHEAGRGAALLRAAREAGIEFRLVRTWEGGKGLERKLRALKQSSRLCPICNPKLAEAWYGATPPIPF